MERRKITPIIYHVEGKHGANHLDGEDTIVGIINSIIITVGICAAIDKYVKLSKDLKSCNVRERSVSHLVVVLIAEECDGFCSCIYVIRSVLHCAFFFALVFRYAKRGITYYT